jgi:hypothetical protein
VARRYSVERSWDADHSKARLDPWRSAWADAYPEEEESVAQWNLRVDRGEVESGDPSN